MGAEPAAAPGGCPCADCGAATSSPAPGESEYYAVLDEVWAAAVAAREAAFLCVGCLEARLGRALAAADFANAPVNFPGFGGSPTARLRDRLRGLRFDEKQYRGEFADAPSVDLICRRVREGADREC